MGLLDAFNQFSDAKCTELTRQNSTFEKITSFLGISNLIQGVQNFMEGDMVSQLLNSPLRELGEDVLSQAIQNNARRLAQNVLNQVPEKITNTLTDIRATAFNAVFATMSFKNDMVLYFASVAAEECVEAIKEKRRTLISLQESVRQLHNALLVLAGGGPFFNEYLTNLKEALVKIDLAEKEVFKVQAAYFSTERFPAGNYNASKRLLDEAYELIMPPETNEDATELKEGFLKNVFEGPSYARQLAMLMNIPKLTFDMLKQYDLYALRVLKVNAFLLGYQSIVQNLKAVTGGYAKDLVIDQLASTRDYLKDIISDMSLQIYGDENTTSNPNSTYSPNPTKTSAKAVSWGVRVKGARVMLEMLDPDAFNILNVSNAALNAYYKSLEDLSDLDDRTSSTAILKATDGREEPGDIEPTFISFAFQANQAILDTALLATEKGRFDPNGVLALGANLNSRLQLSIDQDRDVEEILLRYIKTVAPLIESIKSLGDSVFSLLDGLGMDRASDFLKRGAFGDFFEMNGRTSSYVGAAIAGLSATQLLLSDNAQRECIQEAINKLKVEETSKKLVSQRKVQQNFIKLERTNEKKCEETKKTSKKVEGCASGLDVTDLKDNPLKSLGNIFSGVFGGSVSDSLGGSFGGFADFSFSSGNKGVASLGFGAASGSTIFSNAEASVIAAKDATKNATSKVAAAKKEMSDAVNDVDGFTASPTESLDSLEQKVKSATKTEEESGGDTTALQSSSVTKSIADSATKESTDLVKNVNNVKNVFGT